MAKVLALLLLLGVGMASHAVAQSPAAEEKQLFLFLFRPGPAWREGLPMRQQDLKAHAAYHAELVRTGRAVAAGGYVGMDGGMAIVRAADLAEAQAILRDDPAILNKVFAGELRQWSPRFVSDAPLIEGRD
jgi:uncharacterized protein YciI